MFRFASFPGAYRDSAGAAPPPDSYIPPFYKANREKEMGDAHAIFRKRLDAAIERGDWDPGTPEVQRR